MFLSCGGSKKYSHPCDVYGDALNGTFSMGGLTGTMTFEGGLRGFVEAEGVDYNDMSCGYVILDCNTGTASMDCSGVMHETTIRAISADSVEISGNIYIRVPS